MTSKQKGGRRYAPYAFTEQGWLQVNIEIMRAFVQVQRMLSGNEELNSRINQLDQQFKLVFDAIRELMKPQSAKTQPIGFVWDKKD